MDHFLKDSPESQRERRRGFEELNEDSVFGVFSLAIDQDVGIFRLTPLENVMTAYEDQFSKLVGTKESWITIIGLGALRKGKIEILSESSEEIPENPVLLSNGIIEYFETDRERRHIITSLRDGMGVDSFLRTTSAWRNVWADLFGEARRESIEEGPFLGKLPNGEFCLCSESDDPESIQILKGSIRRFLEEKFHPNDESCALMFERNFPNVRYQDLERILNSILESGNVLKYSYEDGEIPELKNDMKTVVVTDSSWKELSSGKFFVFFDRENNTVEYRILRKITGFPSEFVPISKRPSRLFLESRNQYPRTFRMEQADLRAKVVPTVRYLCEKVRDSALRNLS